MNKNDLTKEFLVQEYVTNRRGYTGIAKKCDIHSSIILKKLKEHGILIRNRREAKLPEEAFVSDTAKWCPGCKINKPMDDFNKSRNKCTGRDNLCKICASKHGKNKYQKQKKARPLSKAELVFEFGDRCSVCGAVGLPMVCYCFHHKDSSKKELGIGGSLTLKRSRALTEAREKCVMVCFNCHCVLHHGAITATQQLDKVLINYKKINNTGIRHLKSCRKNYPTSYNSQDYKRCAICDLVKSLGAFHYDKRSRLGRTVYCKECTANHQKLNRAYHNEKHSRDRAKIIIEFGDTCAMCGKKNLPMCCYVFHHNNPLEKEIKLGGASFSSTATLKEIREKCSLLCQNCHEVTHHGNTTAKKLVLEKYRLMELTKG